MLVAFIQQGHQSSRRTPRESIFFMGSAQPVSLRLNSHHLDFNPSPSLHLPSGHTSSAGSRSFLPSTQLPAGLNYCYARIAMGAGTPHQHQRSPFLSYGTPPARGSHGGAALQGYAEAPFPPWLCQASQQTTASSYLFQVSSSGEREPSPSPATTDALPKLSGLSLTYKSSSERWDI